MKKTPEDDDLRPHYDFDYTKMKPNRFAREKKIYKESTLSTTETQKASSQQRNANRQKP